MPPLQLLQWRRFPRKERPGDLEKIEVSMLGTPRLEWAGATLTVASRKSLALLCYLALSGRPVPRQKAADLLWGGGLANVRQALYQLRQLPGADSWLGTGDELEIRATVDLHRLEQAVADSDFEAAISLWRGGFLTGLHLDDCPELQLQFDDTARRAESLIRAALSGRASEQERAGDLDGALRTIETRLELDPFDEDALRQALRYEYLLDRTGAALQRFEQFSRQLEHELGGQPEAATRELISSLRDGTFAAHAGFDALPVRLRQLLAAVHVAGDGLGIEELAAVLRREAFEVSEGISTLRQMGLLDGLRFNPTAGTFTVSSSDRELLERRVAEVREEAGVSGWREQAQLARHWLRAGFSDRAAPWLVEAARGALLDHQLQDALGLAFRASWTGDNRQRFDAMLVLEAICERIGNEPLRGVALNEAADLAWQLQDDAALCKVEIARARQSARSQQADRAIQHASEALDIARRTGDRKLLALAWNGMGATRFALGQLVEALEAFREAAELEVGVQSMRALSNMGAIHGLREEHEEAYGLFDRALTAARAHGELMMISACLNNLSASAERLGAYDRALRHLHESRELARRTGHRSMEAQVIHNLSVIYMRQGSFGPSWNTSMEVIEEGERTGDLAVRAQGTLHAADVARHCNLESKFLPLMEEAGELLRQLGDQRRLVTFGAMQALSRGPWREVPAEVEAVRALGLNSLYSWLLLELAVIADDRDAGLAFLAGQQWQGPHQEFVAELATLRLLLAEPRPGDAARLSELSSSLALTVETGEYAEAPLACHLIWLASKRLDNEIPEWISRRDELLQEQARGLPGDLRERLLAAPELWQASVGRSNSQG